MKPALLPYLACPDCGSDIRLAASDGLEEGEIRAGLLRCDACSADYPIREFIPRFVPAENYARSFGFQWNTFRETQLDSYWGIDASRQRLFDETRWPPRMEGELVLEAGSGAGRFTGPAAMTGADIVTIDYSDAIDANRANNGRLPNVHFIQADIGRLPLKRGVFDKIFCMGVLQHCPDPDHAFLRLLPHAKPGGSIVVDVYERSWRTLFHGKYYLRTVTRHLPLPLLLWLTTRYVAFWLPLLKAVRKGSELGWRKLCALTAVSDYRGTLDVLPNVMFELCVLDTFDKLSPAHDHPRTLDDVRQWFDGAGLQEAEVERMYNVIVGRGVVPAACS